MQKRVEEVRKCEEVNVVRKVIYAASLFNVSCFLGNQKLLVFKDQMIIITYGSFFLLIPRGFQL